MSILNILRLCQPTNGVQVGPWFLFYWLHKAAEGVSRDQAVMRRSLLLGDFTILDKAKEKSPAGRKRGQTKAKKLPQEKEHERSIKHSRRQPTTHGGSNKIMVEELATARSFLVLRLKLNRRYEEQSYDELLCLPIRTSAVVVQHLSAGHPVFFLLVPC